jgi:putative ABC transport system permease protein
MKLWHSWRSRQQAREDDMRKELSAHLDLEAEEQREAGASEDEARYAAQRALGNQTLVEEEIRDMWVWTWFERLGQDIRYAFRTLRKNAGFTLVAAFSLALGLGGNAAMFSLVDGVLLRPLHYSDPGRLVRPTGYYPTGAFLALQQLSRTMEFATYSDKPENGPEFNLTGQGEAMHLSGSVVSANIFSLLGAGAQLGRTFQPGEDHAGQDNLVILSHALWRNKFESDPSVIGRVIKINGLDRRVIGVMPPDFSFLVPGAQLWIPLRIDPGNPDEVWGHGFKPVVARLRPEATLAQAQSEIRSMVSEIIPMFPYPMARNWNADTTVLPLQQDLVGNIRAKLLVLMGAVGIVLMIACVNVASLLLSLAASRRQEIALRTALGAARGRIVRQLLTESLVLAVTSGAFGLALAFGALSTLETFLPADMPGRAAVGMDWRVLVFVAALSVVTSVAFGLAPALRASRSGLAESVRAGGRRASDAVGINLRSSLIVGEVALAVVLVVGAGLLIRTLWQLMQVNPGFQGEHVLSVRVTPDPSSCQQRAACVALYDEVLRRGRKMPGVSGAAAANTVPLTGEVPYVVAEVEDHPLREGEALAPLLWAGAITPDYFHLMGIPILQGRGFSDADGQKSEGVMIVSAATARKFWHGENPVGKHIRLVWDKGWRTVVGVAGDVRQFNLADRPLDWIDGAIYMPYSQSVDANQKLPAAMYLIARTSTDAADFGREVRDVVSSVNPNVPVGEVRTLQRIVLDSASQSLSLMWVFLSLAAVALTLAAVGTYGVVSYSTAQRTFEIGVRVALGASRGSIFGMVIRQSLELVIVGLGLGGVAALALSRLLSSYLYGITPQDPLTFLAVAGLLVCTALAAGYLPARRATQVDPVVALRHK